MPDIIFSDEDIKSVEQLPVNWYRLRIKDIVEGKGKTDNTSTVWKVSSVVVAPEAFAGVPVTNTFSEKYMGPFVNYLKAFGEVSKGVKIDYTKTIGKEVEAFCSYTEYGNQAKEFRRLGSGKK